MTKATTTARCPITSLTVVSVSMGHCSGVLADLPRLRPADI
jgi:hypothetical protein